jgi:Zn-dependent protease with chaperone function
MSSPTPALDFRRDFLKVVVLPALTFLLIPLFAAGFARYGERKLDGIILQSIESSIDGDAEIPAADRPEVKGFYRAHPPSAVCTDPDPRLDRYRAAVCERWGDVWQFVWAYRLALFAAALGLATFVAIGLLGLVAFWSRRAQYWSFMLGWRWLVAVTVAETIAQGVLAVWLSYWVTALLLEQYVPKLILMIALLAGLAVITIVRALLRRPPALEPLEAELLPEADAPGLWGRVKELAGRFGIEPPRAIVAGIDDNFFVTERSAPLTDGKALDGRVLYVSLPLLRILSTGEADAIFGHELAHFRGGDTAATARLYPMLARYQSYAAMLAGGGLTLPASLVMRLYRAIFELALAREQRRREYAADAEAARITSPDDLARSLLKVAGYSSFRAWTERHLFEQRSLHEGALALGARIAEGLPTHAGSQAFQEEALTLRVPHPYDSHPPLPERIQAVASAVKLEDAAPLLQARPERTWADEVLTGAAIEERLWGAYEARFKANHDVALAYRYLPANEEERGHVVRHFPDLTFEGKKGATVMTHAGVTLPGGASFLFAEIQSAKVDEGTFSHKLLLDLRSPAGEKRKADVDLKALGDQAKPFKEAFSRYWQRDQVARQGAQERAATGDGAPTGA